jgi:hypothetical protein
MGVWSGCHRWKCIYHTLLTSLVGSSRSVVTAWRIHGDRMKDLQLPPICPWAMYRASVSEVKLKISSWKFECHFKQLLADFRRFISTFCRWQKWKKHLKNWKKGLVDSPSRTNFRWKAPSVWTLLHKEECLPAFLVPRYLERFWKVHHVRTHQKFQNSVKRGGHPSPSCTPPHYQKFVPLTVEGQ